MLKAAAIILIAGVLTSVLAALDEEHSFSPDYLTIRLRRNLPVTLGVATSPENALEELTGNDLVRDTRRSRKRQHKKKGHKVRGHKKSKKHDDDSNGRSSAESLALKPLSSNEQRDSPLVLEIPKIWMDSMQNSADPSGQVGQPSQYPPPATSDFLDDDPDSC